MIRARFVWACAAMATKPQAKRIRRYFFICFSGLGREINYTIIFPFTLQLYKLIKDKTLPLIRYFADEERRVKGTKKTGFRSRF
jgi:hypothetical protein